MAVLPSRSSVQFDLGESPKTASAVLDEDAPFRILVIGDFGGTKQPGGREPLASRSPVGLDCDNFDDVMEAFDLRLDLPRAALRFRELDDFHPDSIYRAAPVFEELENLRPAAKAASRPQPPPGGLLDAIVGESAS